MRDKLATRHAELVTTHRRRGDGGFTATLAYEPADFLEMDHGHLYIALEVLGNAKEGSEVADLILQVAREEYYSDLNRDPLAAFEASLQHLNEELAEYASSGRMGWVGRLNAVIAVLSGRNLHLTQVGTAQAVLLRGGKLTAISEGLSPKGEANPLKTFLNIASGTLRESDRLVLTTETLFLTTPQDTLRELLLELSPARTIDRLRPELEKNASLDRLATVIVEVTTEDALSKQYVETEPTKVVIDRTAPTAAIAGAIADVGTIPHKALGGGALTGLRSKLRGPTTKSRPALEPKKQEAPPEPAATPAPKPVRAAPVPSPRTRSVRSPLERLRGLLPKRFRGLGDRRLSLALVLMLFVTLGVFAVTENAKAVTAREEAAIAAAQNKEREVQAAIVIQNREQALRLITEAEDLLAPALHSRDGERRKTAEAIRDQLQKDRDTLFAITRLKDPTVLADLAGAAEDVSAIGLARAPDGTFYAGDSRTGALYRVSGNRPGVAHAAEGVRARSLTLSGEGVVAVLLDPRGLAEWSGSAWSQPALSIGEWPAAVDLATFANFVYLLDPGAGRVWKVPKTVGGYGIPQDYLGNEDNQRIKGALSLAIDGNIYILQPNGEIWKFNQGVRAPFTLSGLPSPIAGEAKLFTQENFSHLYILDREEGRVVVTNLEGAYQRSYLASTWKGAAGIWVDEPGKTLYVLAGNKIYQTPL